MIVCLYSSGSISENLIIAVIELLICNQCVAYCFVNTATNATLNRHAIG